MENKVIVCFLLRRINVEEVKEFVDEIKIREMFNILDEKHGYDTKKVPIEINRDVNDKFAMLEVVRDTLEPLKFVFCNPSLYIIDEYHLWEVVKHEYAHYIDICINKSDVEEPHGATFRELSYELGFWVITEEEANTLSELVLCEYKNYCIDALIKKYFD